MLSRAIEDLQASTIIRVADTTIAVSAVTYPFWRRALHDWSEIASDLAPIFGCIWLLVQIAGYFVAREAKKRGK